MDLDQDLSCSCSTVRRAARHLAQVYDKHLAPSGLRSTQYSLLRTLVRNGPWTVQSLARLVGVDRTTLGRNLRPLQRDGLVSIRVNPRDRRARELTLTDKGHQILDLAIPLWRMAQDSFEAAWGEDAAGELNATMRAISQLKLIH